ncbi:hypothetical protein BaRGS_00018352 [Batillaria attramentaria]|uniref:Secreted protein n=1 Tax=Batillaria attramentaria TaxID=370345 RepID=A0ABD0KT17_9CAEN
MHAAGGSKTSLKRSSLLLSLGASATCCLGEGSVRAPGDWHNFTAVGAVLFLVGRVPLHRSWTREEERRNCNVITTGSHSVRGRMEYSPHRPVLDLLEHGHDVPSS